MMHVACTEHRRHAQHVLHVSSLLLCMHSELAQFLLCVKDMYFWSIGPFRTENFVPGPQPYYFIYTT
jgi:hypothetical protein